MSAKFYFKYEGVNFTETFKSTEGEQYTVKLCSGEKFRNKCLYLEWNKASCKYIKIIGVFQNKYSPSDIVTAYVDEEQSFSFKNLHNYVNKGDTILIAIDTYTHVTMHTPSVSYPATAKESNIAFTSILTPPPKRVAVVEKESEQFSKNMQKLLETGNHSDVVLMSGSNTIRAHKAILSLRSSVFAKMFQNPMKVNQITIEDVSSEVLLQLLHFIYAGNAEIKDSNMARELYVVSNKYDVKDLRNICSTMLKSVDLNSVLDTLIMADLYDDKVLKEAALNFISKNYSKVKALQKWNNFMKSNQSLAMEVLSFVIDKKK